MSINIILAQSYRLFASKRAGRIASRSGFALVLVLASLVLMTGVAIAFLLSMQTEISSSKSYSDTTYVRLAADSVVDLVKSQILQASTEPRTTWASQPGAIRTFKNTSSGELAHVYKLYSSGAMIAPVFLPLDNGNPTEVLIDWKSRPNEYADLNTPVVTGVNTSYPIMDPAIFSSGILGVPAPDPAWRIPASGTAPEQLPMPVQWLYQLRDGRMSAMDPGSKKVPNASASNPIIARVAFWADDETCKININTAGEGAFWDTPRGDSALVVSGAVGFASAIYAPDSERYLAAYQPAQHEFQRYPGHPAGISLKSVFPSLTADQISALTPRVQLDDAGSNVTDPAPAKWQRPTAPLPLKNDRLYASLNELIFKPTVSGTTPAVRDRTDPTTSITPSMLNQLEFVLTASSRAPDLNLFSKPRISMWPINVNPTNRTAVDKWFAQCSTIGGKAFYFQRGDPKSAVNDYTGIARNQEIFAYLQANTSADVPGFGGNFASKYGADRDQILTEMLDYIRCTNLLDDSDTSFTSTVLPYAMSNPVSAATIASTSGAFFGYYGAGQVVPLKIGPNRGFGRFQTISEVGFLFHSMMWDPKAADIVNGLPALPSIPVRQGETSDPFGRPLVEMRGNAPMYRAIFLIQGGNPSQGFPSLNPDYKVEVTGLDGITVNGNGIGFPSPATETAKGGTQGSGLIGGTSSSVAELAVLVSDGWINATNPKDGTNGGATYTLVSAPFPIPGPPVAPGEAMQSNPTFTFVATKDIAITLKAPSGEIVQTFTFKFPNPANPLVTPLPCPTPDIAFFGFNRTNLGRRNRISWAYAAQFFQDQDTVVALERTGKAIDMRWLAVQDDVPANVFTPHVDYGSLSATNNKANSFRTLPRSIMQYSKATFGSLVTNLSPKVPADVPSSVNGVMNALGNPGDWDTGLGDSRDGAYINKPDEGNVRYVNPFPDNSQLPYLNFGGFFQIAPGYATYFAPNRQVPSPGMFGSLPSRLKSGGLWETLLFNPNPAAGDNHRGFGGGKPSGANPPDYLWMDLFTMPIVEPYAISEPFSTAGKINLNYQIVPFTYITRNTALRAAFAANRVAGVHDSDGKYKDASRSTTTAVFRHKINADATLKQFEARFAGNDIFRSATEICSLDLYPIVTAQNMPTFPLPAAVPDQPAYGADRSAIKTWWSHRRLTGDNLREQPYTALYQNLTTQSNTYTVYVRAQTVKKVPGTPADEFTDRDVVTGEYRGSTVIERYLDPNVASYDESTPITDFKFRTISHKQFLP